LEERRTVPLSPADTAHLIRRTGFGVTWPLYGELQALGSREAAVERLVDPSFAEDDSIAPTGIASFLTSGIDLPLMRRWWLDRMATTRAPLVEKLTLFWHSHFPSSTDKVSELALLANQHRLLRHHALGSFHDLLQAVAIDPAMMIYLDNRDNVAEDPQENFGREVLEVFTVGPGGRTEQDVVAMTRAWTGHGLDVPLGEASSVYAFHPQHHDNGPKALFGLPPRNWDGPGALTELVYGARRGPVSRFIAAKLFSFLAYPISDQDPIAERMGSVFRRSGANIQALVRAILLSEEFWSPTARFALVRSPAEWVTAAHQATGQLALVSFADTYMDQMGQELFAPPTVAGWGQNGYWVSTARAWGRAAFARRLRELVEVSGLLRETVDLAPADAVGRTFSQLGIVTPSPSTRKVLEGHVARVRAGGFDQRVPLDLVQLALLSPDFQLA
jgi:uncharacterized protein (DUF1800 family)